jgi:hypothetical protein
MAPMKYALLFISLLVASVILEFLVTPREGSTKFYFLFVEVLVASVILGIVIAHVTNIR